MAYKKRVPSDIGVEADRLGQLGELAFQSLCTLARLQCSTLIPDKTGKDFLVEFAPDITDQMSLDRRRPPRQMVVQVKATKSAQVKLSLSVAERLIKDPKPAVVVAFVYDDNDNLLSTHLIHLLNDQLARVLKKLRTASKQSRTDINHQFLNYRLSESTEIQEGHLGLYAEFASLVPDDMFSYTRLKGHQLATLGYGMDRYVVRFGIDDVDHEAILDGFLGIRDLTPSSFEVSERRFAIELPLHQPAPKSFRIEPVLQYSGEVEFIGKSADDTLKIPCTYTVFPSELSGAPTDAFVVSIELGTMYAHSGRLKFTVGENAFATERSLAEWIEFLRLCRLFVSGEITVTLQDLDTTIPPRRFEGYEKPDDKLMARFTRQLNVLRSFQAVLEYIDDGHSEFAFDDIMRSASGINLLSGALPDGPYPLTAVMPVSTAPIPESSECAGFAAMFRIGERNLGFFIPFQITIDLRADTVEWIGRKNGKPIVDWIRGQPRSASFERFLDRITDLAKTEYTLVWPENKLDMEAEAILRVSSEYNSKLIVR